MLTYLARRIGTGIVVFLSVTAGGFFLFYLRGGYSIAHNVLGQSATRDAILEKERALGLDQPVALQYVRWLGKLMTGDLGRSYLEEQQVTSILATRIPVTLSLVVVSLILTVVLSVVLGVAAATRGGVIDRGLQVLSVAAQAIPGYWLALVLVIVFSLTLRLFPATGYVPISASFGGWLAAIFLPSVAIAVGNIAAVGQQLRGSMLDVLRRDYVRTLRSRGISRLAITFRHVLRNAAGPALTILSLQVIATLGGVVIVERIYALPGLGELGIDSGLQGDVSVVLGIVTFMVIVVVVVNLLVDLLNAFLNPKARTR